MPTAPLAGASAGAWRRAVRLAPRNGGGSRLAGCPRGALAVHRDPLRRHPGPRHCRGPLPVPPAVDAQSLSALRFYKRGFLLARPIPPANRRVLQCRHNPGRRRYKLGPHSRRCTRARSPSRHPGTSLLCRRSSSLPPARARRPQRSSEPAAAAPPAAPAVNVKAHMDEHFAKVADIQAAVVRGDVEGAKEGAKWVAEHQKPRGCRLPDRPASRDEEAAKAVAEAVDIKVAAQGTPDMAAACGSCHAASGSKLAMPAVRPRRRRTRRPLTCWRTSTRWTCSIAG